MTSVTRQQNGMCLRGRLCMCAYVCIDVYVGVYVCVCVWVDGEGKKNDMGELAFVRHSNYKFIYVFIIVRNEQLIKVGEHFMHRLNWEPSPRDVRMPYCTRITMHSLS